MVEIKNTNKTQIKVKDCFFRNGVLTDEEGTDVIAQISEVVTEDAVIKFTINIETEEIDEDEEDVILD